MVKTSVKFQKNRSKTVEGVAHTRYILYRGTEGRKDRRTDGQTDGRNDGKPKTMSLRFSSKRRGTITVNGVVNTNTRIIKMGPNILNGWLENESKPIINF